MPKSIRNHEKKLMLGKSDAWSMSRSSHQPSEPAYYIEDCRIFIAQNDLHQLPLAKFVYFIGQLTITVGKSNLATANLLCSPVFLR